MDFADMHAAGLKDALFINTVAASDSWVALPQAYVNSYLDTVTFPCALRLRSAAHPGRDWLVSWQGATAGSASTLDMPAALASAAGLRQGDPVAFELVPDLPEATVVYVEAATPADWSVIEAEAELLTEAILQQMKAVREGDTVPVWIRGRSSVAVRVLSAAPAATGVLLANESIVTVKPPDRDAEPSLAAQAEGAGDGKAAASDDSGSESDCSAAAPAKPNAKSAAGALSISDLTQRRLTSPLRLRVQEWGDERFNMPLKLGNRMYQTAFTAGAFVNPELAAAVGVPSCGMCCRLQKKPGAEDSEGSLVVVYASADVAAGHVAMASDTVHQLAVTSRSQVWVKAELSSPAALSRVQRLSFSRLSGFAQGLREAEEEDEDSESGDERATTATSAADASDDEDDAAPGQAGVNSFVRDALARGCEPALVAASSSPTGAALRLAVAKQKGVQGIAPLKQAADADVSVETAVVPPLRALFKVWLKAQKTYLSKRAAVPEAPAPNAVSPAYLLLPRALPLTLIEQSGGSTERHSFLVTWQSAAAYKFFVTNPDEALGVDVTTAAPVQYPVSNPILTVRKWAPHVFWKAPAHARVHIPSADSLIPSGKGWLDTELQRALRIAVPYLSIHTQSFWRTAAVPPPGGILVSGGRGSGKTALLERCAAYLSEHPSTACHVSRMNCRDMAGDKLKRIARWLQNCLVTSLMHAPAVVLFDDVDALIPVVPEHAPPQEQHIINSVVEFLAGIFDWLRSKVAETGAQVLLLASCSDAGKLPPLLRATGRLDHLIEVGTPNTLERAGMIEHMLRLRGLVSDTAAVEHVARRTEGFDSSDLSVVIERTVQQRRLADLAGGGSGARVTPGHWDAALAGFQPSAAWEAGAKDSIDATIKGWQDVGGMGDAKEALFEAIELPLRYAKLVAKAPLRLRTGVLLYGPPGCGKTHAVRAAVAAAGVRFIGVKGPELLNKYIGASEEAVRNTFARAQAAAPCVLFFDEFDSIAPQRGAGSDSTGVTERTVNQLLTELDGVEKLQGVCVIAASNRPDLIDTALLRPGRLDRLIYCGFPSRDERAEVLAALFAKISTDGSMDLSGVANATEGFSGADLQAIASEAQLTAVLRFLESAKAKEAELEAGAAGRAQLEPPHVTQQNVNAALRNARPSLSVADRETMDERYRRFRQMREGSTASPFSKQSEATRQTLVDSTQAMKVAMA